MSKKPGTAPVDKVERYDWTKPGDRGRMCKIQIDDLKIDHSYQRSEVSDPNTLFLARNFNWVAFGSLIVMERANGDKFVVDGQQRLLAARRRGDIPAVPCVVFQSNGRDHEARAFISLNVRRAHVKAVDKFNASVLAGLSPEKEIAAWLKTIGLAVSKDGKSMSAVDFPTHLVISWKTNAEACKQAIEIQRFVNGTEPLCAACHDGIWWLVHNGIDVWEHADKLQRLGGRAGMLRSIRTLEIETGRRAGVLGCGKGILLLINHRRRGNRIMLPDTA